MRRDAIFYTLFQRSPTLLFELVNNPPANPQNYRFESVEIKEPNFRIDGVFLPAADDPARTVFFAEVQFQKDESLYHRFFSESLLYLYRNQTLYTDWYGVIIFHSRSLEPENTTIHRALLQSTQVQRIYLDELEEPATQPIGIQLIQLTIAPDHEMVTQGRRLIEQANQGQTENLSRQDIIEVITAIAVYKFTNIDRTEVEAMLGINLEESRLYQQLKAEIEAKQAESEAKLRAESEQQGELKGKLAAVPLLLQAGISPDQIAAQLNLDPELIQEIMRSL